MLQPEFLEHVGDDRRRRWEERERIFGGHQPRIEHCREQRPWHVVRETMLPSLPALPLPTEADEDVVHLFVERAIELLIGEPHRSVGRGATCEDVARSIGQVNHAGEGAGHVSVAVRGVANGARAQFRYVPDTFKHNEQAPIVVRCGGDARNRDRVCGHAARAIASSVATTPRSAPMAVVASAETDG